jgi:hypothetical protein
MTTIHANLSELNETSAGWLGNAPTQFSAPPIATPTADPISVAAATVLADWPGVHETLTVMRSTSAAELATANAGTDAILSATEGENAALITRSAGG